LLTERVLGSSVREMNHLAMVAEVVGAEALTLHMVKDDRPFSPADLLPFCERTGIPFIYDVHHHRCNSDGMPVTEATRRAIQERTA